MPLPWDVVGESLHFHLGTAHESVWERLSAGLQSCCPWRDVTSCGGLEKGNCMPEKRYLIYLLLVLLCPFLLRVKLLLEALGL